MDPGTDDPGDLYPHEFVATIFSPWANVSRAQVVTMVVRAAQQLYVGGLQPPPAAYKGSLPAFSDIHGPNMLVAEYNDLLEGLVAPPRRGVSTISGSAPLARWPPHIRPVTPCAR